MLSSRSRKIDISLKTLAMLGSSWAQSFSRRWLMISATAAMTRLGPWVNILPNAPSAFLAKVSQVSTPVLAPDISKSEPTWKIPSQGF